MENRFLCLTFSFTGLLLQLQCGAVTVENDFFSYGIDVGDLIIEREDDATASRTIPSGVSYPFFGRNSPSKVHLSVNGVITFKDILLYYNSSFRFPDVFNYPAIAVFWGDADIRISGQLFHRISSDVSSLQKATQIVRRAFLSQRKFEALSVMVGTWIDVGYFKNKADLLNSYQCVVVSDSKHVFVILLYADIQWVRADDASFGIAGFNAGDRIHSYTLPGSGSSSVGNLTRTSNVAIDGLWVYQVLGNEVVSGGCANPSVSMESTHQVDLTPILSSPFPILLSTFQSITLAWNPAHIIPIIDISTNSFNLDILIYTMDVISGFWQVRYILANNIPNNGSRTVTLQAVLSDDVQPLAIYISTTLDVGTRFGSDQLIQNLFASKNQIGVWTAQYYYVNSDLANQKGRERCSDWYKMEPVSDPGIACPPMVERARLSSSGLIERNFTSMSGNTLYGTQWLQTFHKGSLSCFMQVLVVDRSVTTPPAQQECCYQGEGNLITGAPNGGTINKVAVDFNALRHFQEDRRPFILCCTRKYPNCGLYYKKRPSSRGLGFNPALPAWLIGDPHFITLDGLRYTFNGHGEFVLIQTSDKTFTLQGRMVPLPSINASVFSALVAKVGSTGDRIQIQTSRVGPSQGGLDVYINGIFASSELLLEKSFNGFLFWTKGTGMIRIHFSNGVYLECRTSGSKGLMTTVIIGVPSSFRSNVKGLLGFFNGDKEDDFTPADNSAPLPINSDMSAIHSSFGLSWLITDVSDSLFSYFPYENFNDYKDSSFQPVLQVTPDATVRKLCLEDPFCMYDRIVTGSNIFGEETLDTILQVKKMQSLSNLVSCDPPCKNGICLPNNKCACSQGFTNSTCETPIIQDCFGSGPCKGTEACELHAGSYTCLCPSDASGDSCRVTTADASNEGWLNSIISCVSSFLVGLLCGVCIGLGSLVVYIRWSKNKNKNRPLPAPPLQAPPSPLHENHVNKNVIDSPTYEDYEYVDIPTSARSLELQLHQNLAYAQVR